MRTRSLVLSGACLASLSLGAAAQPSPQAQTPPPAQQALETVVVTAGNPAIWHATKDGADVAILGIVQPLPDGLAWNTKPLEAILAGARRVLLPPEVRMGVFSGAWFYLTEGGLLHPPHNKTLWDVLDPSVAAELERECANLREPKEEYSNDSPIRAAVRLGSDFRHVDYLTTHEPEDRITALAHEWRVAVRHVANYDLIPSGEELLKLPASVTGKCIEAEIRDIDFQSRHVAAAASAWATGDVSGMMANWASSDYYQCLVGLSPHASGIDARSIDDTVEAINGALSDGGRTIAVVDIGLLLRPNGVLDRLKAASVSITRP